MLTSPGCRARVRTLYIDPAAGKPTRPWHRRDTRQHRIDGGALFIVDCDPIPRPLRMLTAILRGCESVDFGDFDTSAFSADLGQAPRSVAHLRMMVAGECRRHDIAYRPFAHAETRRRRCLTIRRNAMKLKPGSRGHRKRLTMRRRPRRIMSPRLGPFEKRLHD
jgi:hypothetical protein